MPENAIEVFLQFMKRNGENEVQRSNVTSVGVGYRVRGGEKTSELVIQYSVDKKIEPQALSNDGVVAIPKSHKFGSQELPTDVVERDFTPHHKIVTLPTKDERKQRLDILKPGISIGHPHGGTGTLGTIVRDKKSNQPAILSNWHVLHGPQGKVGDPTVQPGPFDDNRVESNVIGKLVRSHLGLSGDCAISSIEQRGFDSRPMNLENVGVVAIGTPELGDIVVKSGRTTGVTYGKVSRVGAIFRLPYGLSNDPQVIGGFEIEIDPNHVPTDQELSKRGDSGAVWFAVDEQGKASNIMLGLHFGGDPDGAQGEYALACLAPSVFEKLELEPLAAPEATTEPVNENERVGRKIFPSLDRVA